MYPAKFDYKRAASVEEALGIISENDEAKLLAGGHSLIPVMKLRLAQPEMLVDIGRLEGLDQVESGSEITIGALATHSKVEHHPDMGNAIYDAVHKIGDPSVRNRGTVGGNIAHADPASDWPTLLVGLNATIHTKSTGGTATHAAADFFTGLFETALGEGEMVTHVTIPSNAGSAYAKLSNPASRYAIIGCCAQVSGGSVQVAIGGLLPNARRCPSVEAALAGKELNEANIAAAADAVLNDLPEDDVIGDMHASAAYRRQVAPAMVKRALMTAASRS